MNSELNLSFLTSADFKSEAPSIVYINWTSYRLLSPGPDSFDSFPTVVILSHRQYTASGRTLRLPDSDSESMDDNESNECQCPLAEISATGADPAIVVRF